MCSKPSKRVTFELPSENGTCNYVKCVIDKEKPGTSKEDSNTCHGAHEKNSGFNKKASIKKLLVRHVDSDIPANKIVTKIPDGIQVCEVIDSLPLVPRSYKTRYAVPELFSALCLAKEFQGIKEEESKNKCLHVPVAVKQFVDGKAANKLNFTPEQQLFKDLVNLNVNDDMLISAAEERPVTWKLPKDEEPRLSDFYQPKFLGEYPSICEPTLTAIGKIRNYNGFSTYKRIRAWTSGDCT